ncbi:hypothetical protein ASE01_03975 [Nocardioides sp. Root190]|uniref:hypothetical protein n=1 Tax=Nocardioides sp. Root190 TaxID=1736488 RepID=UPI0006F1F82A|nr:hypothetical protein [Nocardioides sp. Root190]KRB78433.1 hypothetical protein ASE01_03975 [Nocardioides sp. Root190]
MILVNEEVLKDYLQHHWVGSTAGVALFRRVGRTHADPDAAAEVRDLAVDVAADRETLRGLMISVDVAPSTIGTVVARLAEALGRLKPNGRVLSRSPLTDVVELEALRLATAGRRAGFEVLRAAADDEPRLDPYALDRLLERADEHLRTLDRLHVSVSRQRLVADAGPHRPS